MNEDKAARYHRLRRRASLLSTSAGALVLLLLLVTGASAALRNAAAVLASGSFTVSIAIYVVLIALIGEVVQLPLAFYQAVTLERRYGLSTQSNRGWWIDHVKAGAVALIFAVGGAELVWHLLRRAPEVWWVVAAVCFSVMIVGMAQLAPVLILPLFYTCKPLDRPALRDRLVALADRAGARVLGVFEWRLSDRTRKANAALTGLGRTRRILVSDTLLADHSDDEIEVILAHEIAHHVHRDIWKDIALEVALVALGFNLADRALSAAVGWFGVQGKADVAALPVLLLAAGAVSLALMPLANALSRAHERHADHYALEMTRNAPAFVTAMKRLGATNLAEEHPSRLVEMLFYTHPPVDARIAAAHAWAVENMKTA